MVILSRHNIRSPLVSKNSVLTCLTRLTNSSYQWFRWEGSPSNLTAKGERLEAKMGAFFKGLLIPFGRPITRSGSFSGLLIQFWRPTTRLGSFLGLLIQLI